MNTASSPLKSQGSQIWLPGLSIWAFNPSTGTQTLGDQDSDGTPTPTPKPSPMEGSIFTQYAVHTPPGSQHTSKDDQQFESSEPPLGGNRHPLDKNGSSVSDRTSSRPSSLQRSVSFSGLNGTLSRTDSSRSSMSAIARGVGRHAPDMGMFLPSEKKVESIEGESVPVGHQKTHVTRAMPPSILRKPSVSSASKTSNPTEAPPAPKKALKDRRFLPQDGSNKFTLALDLADLPVRNRVPAIETPRLLSPRQRSPKTPWTTDRPPEWYGHSTGTAAPTIPENHSVSLLPGVEPFVSSWQPSPEEIPSKGRSCGRVRFGGSRKSARSSESSRISSVHATGSIETSYNLGGFHHANTQQELKELGKRARRFRWGKPWGFKDEGYETPHPERAQSFSFSRLMKNKCSKQSMPPASLAAIDKMPLPPTFCPPGMRRIPTPPMLEENEEIEEQLADFSFNMYSDRQTKPPTSPGGIWDSDALLMSQSIISPSGSDSDGPLQASVHRTSVLSPYTVRPLHLVDATWAHADADRSIAKDPSVRAAEEKAKLEWLTPEHLPNSPLCPLRDDYMGLSSIKGVCVYHGKKWSTSQQSLRRQSRTRAVRNSGGVEGKRERGQSRSGDGSHMSRSALDGGEEEERTADLGVCGKPSRKKRAWMWRKGEGGRKGLVKCLLDSCN